MSMLIGAVSEFSLGESLLSPEEIAQIAADKGYSAVALTDRNLSSMMRFTKACNKVGVKPIIGASVSVYDDAFDKTPKKKRETPNLYFQLRLFVRTEEGMRGVYRLLTLAASEERFYHHPRLALVDVLEELDRGGLAVSSGSFWSVFAHPHWASKWRAIVKAARGHAYRELVAVNTPYFQRLNEIAIGTNQEDPYLLSRPVLYADRDYAETLDVLRTIIAQQKMSQPFRSIQWVRDLVPCSQERLVREHVAKMHGFLAERIGVEPSVWRSALVGNEALAESCQYHWHEQEISLPAMADDEEAEIVRLIRAGWEERLGGSQLGFRPFDLEPYKQRLGYELRVLREMGFIRYFLLVRDLIAWAKENNIRVGPARGSVAGSLVAYLIHITDIDPLRFDLLFERFINPDRLELPDIDMDFATSGRERVLRYLVKRHGEDSVSAITNFSTLASASALREVCRVHELPAIEYECTKLVPKDAGLAYELNEAADAVPELATFRREQSALWTHAVRLQGRMRAYGAHAAGVCVGGEPIVNRGALTHKKGGLPTVGYDKREVEDQGLIKIDVLGLSTLDIHKIALDLVKERHGRELQLIDIPLDDTKTLAAFARGETEAVFQMEGAGARRLLVEMGKAATLTFEDVVAVNALNRPAALQSGMAEEYVKIRRGDHLPKRRHPKIDPVLEKTLGIIIYQEQTMQLFRAMAGFSLSEADKVRKAIGKKDRDLIASLIDEAAERARAGWITVELEDGSQRTFHKAEKFHCTDGVDRTVEQAIADDADMMV